MAPLRTLLRPLCGLALALTLAPAWPARAQVLADTPAGKFSLSGYVEGYYAYDFAAPANRIVHFRGFDNRHNTFTLSNAVFDVRWQKGQASGRLALQIGSTPSTYYLAEPAYPGAPGANATGPEMWKLLQQAYVGYEVPVGHGLLVQGGLFLSPIGPEQLAAKDSWNFSRSNLFVASPFYHVGVRATYGLSQDVTTSFGVYNGWNSIVDGNADKSLSMQINYKQNTEDFYAQLLYFGGGERATGAPEGRAWRHLVDGYVGGRLWGRLQLQLQLDAGLESNRFGTFSWAGAAAYARLMIASNLFLAARGDYFRETAPLGAAHTFFPAEWVASQTATVEARATDGISVRLEFRHDQADTSIYFRSVVEGDGVAVPYRPNARSQDTLSLSGMAWF